jgi:hypothetical protein
MYKILEGGILHKKSVHIWTIAFAFGLTAEIERTLISKRKKVGKKHHFLALYSKRFLLEWRNLTIEM